MHFDGVIPEVLCRAEAKALVAGRNLFGRSACGRFRPLTAKELARYSALFETQLDNIRGAQLVIEAMLQSPNFLFWLDDTPNPSWKAYATASRLSNFFWITMPDDALLAS